MAPAGKKSTVLATADAPGCQTRRGDEARAKARTDGRCGAPARGAAEGRRGAPGVRGGGRRQSPEAVHEAEEQQREAGIAADLVVHLELHLAVGGASGHVAVALNADSVPPCRVCC